MPYIKLNGIKVFYILNKVSGGIEAESIILVHGAGGNHLSMLSIYNHIKKKYTGIFNVLIFDLPYHFRSVQVETADTQVSAKSNRGIAYYAEIIHAIASNLLEKNKGVILIGHSMGAQICLKYASLFPLSADKIMLIAGCHKTVIKQSFIESLEKSFERTIMLFLKEAYASKDGDILNNALKDIKRTPAQTVINDFKYIKYYSEHYDTDIKRINSSKIFFNILYSKKDLIINYKCAEDLHKKLLNCTIKDIPAESHIDFLNENSFTEKEIDKFLLT